jgi:choline dehydrogenase-like flavoprotein
MGAAWTSIVTSPGTAGGPGGRTTEHAPMSRHVMGTVRMGEDPETSVADRDGRLHQLPNVMIADSSLFVTSSGYGPTLTLAALAARSATALLS